MKTLRLEGRDAGAGWPFPALLGPALLGLVLLGLALPGCKGQRAAKPRERPAVVVVDSEDELENESLSEKEPNDDKSEAQELPFAETLAGTLQHVGDKMDRDWYRLSVQGEAQVLRVESSGAAKVDLALVLRDDAGKVLVRANDAGIGGGEMIVNLGVSAGVYFVQVEALSADVKATAKERTYRLRAVVRPPEAGEELEPNGEKTHASTLSWDSEAMGYCGWRKDVDWYRVELPEALGEELLRFELDGVDGVRPTLEVKLGAKKRVRRRARARGEPVVLANLVPPAARESHGPSGPSERESYVVVHCGKGYNLESRYAVRVSSTSAAGMEQEPNDTASSATPIASGVAARGILADLRDRDLYSVDIPSQAVVRLRARPPAALDLALAVVDDKGTVLREVDERRAGGMEVIVPLVWSANRRIRLRAPRAAAVDPLSPYRVALELLSGQGWEREPNDLPQRATRWEQGQAQMRGFVHPRTDVDHFRITSVGSTLRVGIRVPSGASLIAELLDGQTVVESVSSGADGGQIWLEAQVETGRPYLLRLHTTAEQSNHEQPYRVEFVNVVPVGPAPTETGAVP